MQQRGGDNAYLRLFRAVLAEAVRDPDAAQWIKTQDGAMVCALADVERAAVERAILRGDVPKPRAQTPSKPPSRRKKCGNI
ncbi:MAG: hypothetical protein ACXIUO_07355 [Erythrobacter sp.]